MKKFKLNIQLFAEAEAEAENFGKATEDIPTNGDADLKGEDDFSTLINGKYKKEFSEKVQEIIDKRFKKTKALERFYNDAYPILNELERKYGTDEGDFEALKTAINENFGLGDSEKKEHMHEFDEEAYAESALKVLVKEGESLKEMYPDFDLRSELKNNALFAGLLKNGISVKDAFETAHKDELIRSAMAYAAKTVREQMANAVEIRNKRPLENGLVSTSAAVTKQDVNALTKNDILNILKQVEKGAKIEF